MKRKPRAHIQPPLSKSGLSEAEVWWHDCADSKRREYRANGWDCAQCGASGPDGNVAMFAFATGLALVPTVKA